MPSHILSYNVRGICGFSLSINKKVYKVLRYLMNRSVSHLFSDYHLMPNKFSSGFRVPSPTFAFYRGETKVNCGGLIHVLCKRLMFLIFQF